MLFQFRLLVLACAFLGLSITRAACAQLSPVAVVLQPFVDQGSLAGAVTMVGTKDKLLDFEAVGYADLATRRPMATNTLFCIASMTKPMTATAFMMLVDEGKVSVNDPVDKYIPEFRDIMVAPVLGQSGLQKPVHPLLIRELLNHTSGMDFAVPGENAPFDRLSLVERVRLYVKRPLLTQPGVKFHYSNAGINTVGRIIEIVSGVPYEAFMEERLFKPLGMTDTTFWPNKEQVARLASAYKANAAKDSLVEISITPAVVEKFSEDPKRCPLPAGGLFSTANNVMRFMKLIVDGGVRDGKQLVSAVAVQQMTRNETSLPEEYGYGWKVSGGHIGHDGLYRTSMNYFPKTGLLVVFLVHQSGPWPNGGDQKILPAFNQVAERMTKQGFSSSNPVSQR